MFYLHTIGCNIKRNRTKSIITAGICVFVLLLLNMYLKNIDSSKQQLESLPSVTSVYCRITNLNGSLEVGLEISEDLVDNLLSSNKIKDAAFTVRLLAGEGEFPLEDWKEKLTLFVAGANRVTAIAGLSPENIHMEEEAVTDFFASSAPVCLVSEPAMGKHQWEIGDTIPLNLFYQYYDDRNQLYYEPLEVIEVEILGTMDTIISNTGQMPADILLPFETLRESYRRQQVPFFADSTSFYVADPLQLNAFKEEMRSFGLMEKIPAADYNYQGIALAVRDSTFRTLAGQLRQSIDTLQSFYPLIGVTILCIGYIVSFLLMNSRQKEFALMRALGTGRGTCFRLFLLEQLALILIGGIVGGTAAIWLFGSGSTIILAGSIFIISYFVGCMAALWRVGRTSVTEALFSRD